MDSCEALSFLRSWRKWRRVSNGSKDIVPGGRHPVRRELRGR
jgi:hypothetical protein